MSECDTTPYVRLQNSPAKDSSAEKRKSTLYRLRQQKSYDSRNSQVPSYYRETQLSVEKDNALRKKSLRLFVLAMTGLLLMMIDNIICFDSNYGFIWLNPNSPIELVIALNIIQSINVVITILCVLQLMDYYRFLAQVKQLEHSFPSAWTAFRHTTIRWWFLLELAILLPTPIPILNRYWLFFDVFALLMFLRLYLLIRVLRDYSNVYINRAAIIESNPRFKKTLPKFDWELTLRMLFYDHTVAFLACSATLIIFIGSFSTWVVERRFADDDLDDFLSCIFYIMVTMATIGYGSHTPNLLVGKAISISYSFLGVVMSAMAIGVIVNKLTPTAQQHHALEWITNEKLDSTIFVNCIRILQVNFLAKKGKCSLRYCHSVQKECIKHIRLHKALRVTAANSAAHTFKDEVESELELMRNLNTRADRLLALATQFRDSRVVFTQ